MPLSLRVRVFTCAFLVIGIVAATGSVPGAVDARVIGMVRIETVDDQGTPLPGACFSVEHWLAVPGEGSLGVCDRVSNAVQFSTTLVDTNPVRGVMDIGLTPDTYTIREFTPPTGMQATGESLIVELDEIADASQPGNMLLLTFSYQAEVQPAGNAPDQSGSTSLEDRIAALEAQVLTQQQTINGLNAQLAELQADRIPIDPNGPDWNFDYLVESHDPIYRFGFVCNINEQSMTMSGFRLECIRPAELQ